MHTVIYDTQSRAVLVLDPQVDAQGVVVLPVGVAAATTTIGDTEFAKLSTAGSRFSVAADGATITVTAVTEPPDPVRQQRTADAVVILNNAAVMTDQPTRDAMARTIGVQPLTIPISQRAVSTDIVLAT